MRGIDKTFGERIRDLEQQYDTQKEFSKKMGVSTRTIRNWKNRDEPPTSWRSRSPKEGVKSSIQQLIKRREYYYFRSNDRNRAATTRDITEGVPDWFVTNAFALPGSSQSDYEQDVGNVERDRRGRFIEIEQRLNDFFGADARDRLRDIFQEGRPIHFTAYAYQEGEPEAQKKLEITIQTENISDISTINSQFWARFRGFWERNYEDFIIVIDAEDFEERRLS